MQFKLPFSEYRLGLPKTLKNIIRMARKFKINYVVCVVRFNYSCSDFKITNVCYRHDYKKLFRRERETSLPISFEVIKEKDFVFEFINLHSSCNLLKSDIISLTRTVAPYVLYI